MILRDAFHGLMRFDEFQKSLGIAPNILTRRLAHLIDEGLFEKRLYSERPARYEYVLTDKGRDFFPVLMALFSWGADMHPKTISPSCSVMPPPARNAGPSWWMQRAAKNSNPKTPACCRDRPLTMATANGSPACALTTSASTPRAFPFFFEQRECPISLFLRNSERKTTAHFC